jgi:hypothetical protein
MTFVVQTVFVAFAGGGNPIEGIARESIDGPSVHRDRADRPVETDRGLVPIQDRPFHPAGASRDGHAGDMREERPSDALTRRWLDEEIPR